MIGEMYTPPINRDLMSSGMPTFELDPTTMGMGSMYGGMGMMGMPYTNYLGGVRLKPALNKDTVSITQKKDKESRNAAMTALIGVAGFIGFAALATFLKGKGITWYKPKTWFNPTPPTT